MTIRVAWSDRANAQLRDVVPWQDAAWIASEVLRYAEHGIGDVRRVPLPNGQMVRTLFLPSYRVVFAFNRTTRTLWVRSVFRSTKPG